MPFLYFYFMKNHPIGIFDSGIGGLTVANAIKNKLPNENIIYFGDTQHLPYGEKSEKAIQNFSKKIIKFLVSKKCKIIIIACNSASSVAKQKSTITDKKIPVFNVIDPVVHEVSKNHSNDCIGVIGTKATISSGIYEKKIAKLCGNRKINSLATPLFAPMIEEGFINEDISNALISSYLSNKRLENINHLILACTHYPLIQEKINNYYQGQVNVIDSSNIVARHIAKHLKNANLLNNNISNEHLFYVSNYTKSFEKSAKFFFKETIKLKEISLFH